MEKYTVDLDKVLDEFEYNEDRAEQLASKPQPQSTRKVPYRRPHFEPINIADADFGAATERPIQSHWSVKPKPADPARVANSFLEEHLDLPKLSNESSLYDNNSFREGFMDDASFLDRHNAVDDDRNLPDVTSTLSGGNSSSCDLVTNLSLSKGEPLPILDVQIVESKAKPVKGKATIAVNSTTTKEQEMSFADKGEPAQTKSSTEINRTIANVFEPDIDRFEVEKELTESDTALSSSETESDSLEFKPLVDIAEVAQDVKNVDKKPDVKEIPAEDPVVEVEAKVEPIAASFQDVEDVSDSELLDYLQEMEKEESSQIKKDTSEITENTTPNIDNTYQVSEESTSESDVTVSESEPEFVADLAAPYESIVDKVEETSSISPSIDTTEEETLTQVSEEDVVDKDVGTTSIPVVNKNVNEVAEWQNKFDGKTDQVMEMVKEKKVKDNKKDSKEVQKAAEDHVDEVVSEVSQLTIAEERTVNVDGDVDEIEEVAPVIEVRSPMIQSPRDGTTVQVRGEEERPTRPKFLLLNNVATTDSMVDDVNANPSTNDKDGHLDNIRNNLVEANLNQNVPVDDIGEPPAYSDDMMGEASGSLSDEASGLEQAESLPPDATSYQSLTPEERQLGKLPPFWIPDQDSVTCMLCDVKFTVIKRRHHCRACGKVLCSKCCNLKFHLEYMDQTEARVCQPCHDILLQVLAEEMGESATGSPRRAKRQPNPNNPMEYCSTIPPLQQEASGSAPPSVLVPVLKREGSVAGRGSKQVMFSDGIRPGGDLTELDGSAEPRVGTKRPARTSKRVGTPPGPKPSHLATLDSKCSSYLPPDGTLPPLAAFTKGELSLRPPETNTLMATLAAEGEPALMFAINRNLFVNVKIINLSCCVNKRCLVFTSRGLASVGQDEVMIVMEMLKDEQSVPVDMFGFYNKLYQDAVKGSTVTELGCTVLGAMFLGSSQHGAFLYIRPTFQCLSKLEPPPSPYLVGLLVHKSEVPWARVFPLRLVLRLGAEFRYYPCSLLSVRLRPPVFREIGHTIINLLADFRSMTYTLPAVRGLTIHMQDRQTSVLLPRNRYDQVTRALNNSNDHVLALAANFSQIADSHLVCVQAENDGSYSTQAINIHNKPRKVTGASFVVFNGALKTTTNLTAKSSIVEDGLMVQITPDSMVALRSALRDMKDWSVGCGQNGSTPDETVDVRWTDDDAHFNVGVVSEVDGRSLAGVPSIRVHNGTDYLGPSRLVRWTEVFILKSEENGARTQDPVDVGRVSESIAKATCVALVKLLDLLAQADFTRVAVRAALSPDNVGYEVGSRGVKLPPIYMNSLDNELVPVLHSAAAAGNHVDAELELVFHVLLQ